MFFDTHVVIILSLSVQNEVKYWLAGPDQMSTNVKLESCLLMWLKRAPNLFSAHLIKSNRRNMVVPTVYKNLLVGKCDGEDLELTFQQQRQHWEYLIKLHQVLKISL